MVDATANESTETYDERVSPAVGSSNSGGPATTDDSAEQMTFRLELVLVSGREGEILQAIQARAIREALLWAVGREGNSNNPGEGGNDGRND